MTWLDEEWDAFGALLEHGWPGDFSKDAGMAYRVLLSDVSPSDAVLALKRLVARGGTFRPSASELAAEVTADAGRPTWAEAYRLLFGARGFLTVRPERAAIERAAERHPLLAAFITQQGYQRLSMLPVHDPDRGEHVRRDLERAWNRLEERAAERTAAGLALDEIARPRRIGPRRPDYLRALPSAPTEDTAA